MSAGLTKRSRNRLLMNTDDGLSEGVISMQNQIGASVEGKYMLISVDMAPTNLRIEIMEGGRASSAAGDDRPSITLET